MESDLPCNKIKTLLSAYLDNELSETESNIIKNHICKCPGCSNDLNNIKNVSTYLKNHGKNLNLSQSKIASNVINRLNIEKEPTCNEVLKELSAYYDGELPLKLHYLISNHINTCPACQTEYENLAKVSKLVKYAYSAERNLQVSINLQSK